MGILVCACGGNYERMQELCKKYNAKEVSHCYCKQAQEMPNGSRKCERPGNCPGQVSNNLQFRMISVNTLLSETAQIVRTL